MCGGRAGGWQSSVSDFFRRRKKDCFLDTVAGTGDDKGLASEWTCVGLERDSGSDFLRGACWGVSGPVDDSRESCLSRSAVEERLDEPKTRRKKLGRCVDESPAEVCI